MQPKLLFRSRPIFIRGGFATAEYGFYDSQLRRGARFQIECEANTKSGLLTAAGAIRARKWEAGRLVFEEVTAHADVPNQNPELASKSNRLVATILFHKVFHFKSRNE